MAPIVKLHGGMVDPRTQGAQGWSAFSLVLLQKSPWSQLGYTEKHFKVQREGTTDIGRRRASFKNPALIFSSASSQERLLEAEGKVNVGTLHP